MRHLSITAVVFSILLSISCSQQSKTGWSYSIQGNVPDITFEGQTVFLFDKNTNQKIDSVIVKDKKFAFTGQTDTASLSFLRVGDLYSHLLLEKGTIIIDLSKPNAPSGTPLNDAFTRTMQVEDSLNVVFGAEFNRIEEQATNEQELTRLQQELYENKIKPIYRAMVNENYANHQNDDLGIVALQSMTEVYNAEELDSILLTASPFLQSRPIIQKQIQRNAVSKATEEGKPFVDFSITQENGDVLSLSDYVGKGKYVLVDFWASWCGPCRGEIPAIAEVYNQYKDKNFDVLSVAVWEKPEASRAGIKELNMNWNHIVNAQTIPSEKYGFSGIPHIILFGPDGTIIARNLRGEKMKAKLKEVLE
jgi:Peroxiredoxin